MTDIINVTAELLIYWTLNIFFSGYLERKNINKGILGIGAIVYTAVFLICGISDNFYINFALNLAINLIVAFLFYKGKLFKLTTFALLYQFIGVMGDLLIRAIITVLTYTIAFDSRVDIYIESIGNLMTKVIVFLIVTLLRCMFKEKHYSDSPRDLAVISSFSLLASIIMVTVFRIFAVATIPVIEHILLLFLMPALLFSSLIFFFYYDNTMKHKELEMELEISKEMEKVRDTLLEQHEKNIDEKNATIHNFKNNIVHLTEIIDQPEAALAYCDEMVDGYTKQLTYYRFDVGNNVINAILGRLKYDCDQNNIKLDLQISYNDLSFISPVDASNLFGNLFDNAINACCIMPKGRWIKVVISVLNDFVHITVSNSKANDIILNNNNFLSTRRGYSKKGSGVDTIKSTVKRYSGDINIAYDNTIFTCTFWLNRLTGK